MRGPTTIGHLIALTGFLSATVSVTAQTTRPRSTEPSPAVTPDSVEADSPDARGLLAGPEVVEEDDGDATFTFGANPRRNRSFNRLAPRLWFRAVFELDLEPKQRREIQVVTRQLAEARRRFGKDHGEELTELRRKMQEVRRGDQRPDPTLRARLEKTQRSAPKVETYQQRVWNMLDDGQQRDLKAKLTEIRRRQAERRRAQRARDEMTDRPERNRPATDRRPPVSSDRP